MWKYVVKRIALALITTFVVISLTFILIKSLDPEKKSGNSSEKITFYSNEVRLGYMYVENEPLEGVEYIDSATDPIDSSVRYYYYKVPAMQQYFNWLKNIVTEWNWGTSRVLQPNVDATVIIGEGLATSVKINILPVFISVPVGIALGIWAALKKNKPTDHIISTSVMVLNSLPGFVLITFLLLVFSYGLGWLPTQWPNPTDPTPEKIKGYILPIFCLSLGSICYYCRYVRAELCEILESEYLLLARTKGLTRGQSIVRHALKNALVPIFPAILSEFIGIIGGSMILEQLYGIPGIGKLFVQAMSSRDYNVLFVDMAIFTTFGLLAGVLLDMSYGFIDPRIRMGER